MQLKLHCQFKMECYNIKKFYAIAMVALPPHTDKHTQKEMRREPKHSTTKENETQRKGGRKEGKGREKSHN